MRGKNCRNGLRKTAQSEMFARIELYNVADKK